MIFTWTSSKYMQMSEFLYICANMMFLKIFIDLFFFIQFTSIYAKLE